MKSLTINPSKARELFLTASPEFKQELISHFGEAHFKQREWEKCTSYEEVCKIEGVDPEKHRPYPNPQTPEDELTNAFRELVLAQKVINRLDDNYKPIYGDSKNPKVYVIVDMRGGVCFSYTHDGYTNAHADVGSRFVFSCDEIAQFFAKHFMPQIQKLQTLLNTI